ncbi:MAG: alpha-L-fucosidase [Butyrivibrio sp.]|nr:alpha-L-fucosidase [Butyrivibrio sp.]
MSVDYKKLLEKIDKQIEEGPFKDNWESLSKYQVPDWYKDIKFGIFIHWGVYSAAAYANEWYPRNMYIKDSDEYKHHIETYGPHKDFGYKDYIPMLTGANFDADKWLKLFEDCKAQYMVPVAEHHDGFQMYASEISEWNAAKMGPHKDIIGELMNAADKTSVVFGVSSHRIEHWWFLGHGREFESDIKGEFERGHIYWPSMEEPDTHFNTTPANPPTAEYMEDWLIRTCEIVDRFHPAILYFDWWIEIEALRPYLKKALAYYYNAMAKIGRMGVVNYKHDEILQGCAVPTVERGQFADIKPYVWQTDTSTCFNSWGYTVNNRYKEPQDIVCDLVDVVSKNGRMLLNIGPKPDGTITDEETAILQNIGKWLSVGSEGLYGCHTYKVFGEGPLKIEEGMFKDAEAKVFSSKDFRFTVNKGNIYVYALGNSEDGIYRIETFGRKNADDSPKYLGRILKVVLPGTQEEGKLDKELAFEMRDDALEIKCDKKSRYPLVFKLEVL